MENGNNVSPLNGSRNLVLTISLGMAMSVTGAIVGTVWWFSKLDGQVQNNKDAVFNNSVDIKALKSKDELHDERLGDLKRQIDWVEAWAKSKRVNNEK